MRAARRMEGRLIYYGGSSGPARHPKWKPCRVLDIPGTEMQVSTALDDYRPFTAGSSVVALATEQAALIRLEPDAVT